MSRPEVVVDGLLARLDVLERRNRELEERVGDLDSRCESPPPSGCDPGFVTRRRLLGLAGAAAAVGTGNAILAASPAGAASNDPVLVDNMHTGTGTTQITSTTSGLAFFVKDLTAESRAIVGQATAGTGVQGSTDTGIAVQAAVNQATGVHLHLIPQSNLDGPPTSGTNELGQFVVDLNGVLFQCIAAGTPGTWVRQAPLVILPAPVRVYDSRPGLAPTAIGPKTKIAVNEDRLVDATGNSSGVPASASAVLMSLTVTSTVGSGFLGVFKDGIAYPNTSNINWSASGQKLATAVTTAVANAGKLRIHCGGNITHVIVDIAGYYA